MSVPTVVIYTEHSFSFWCFPEWGLEELRRRFPSVRFHLVRQEAELLEVLPSADVYLGWQFRPEWLAHAPRLRWIHSPAAGVRRLMFPELVDSPIVVTNARGIHAVVIAEHVIGVMILLYRQFLQCWEFQRRRHWGNEDLIGSAQGLLELADRTVLVLGYGALGQAIGRRARALDMHVWAARRHPERESPYAERTGSLTDAVEWLPEADFVVITLPHTEETHGWMDRTKLERMKPTAYLINVARGAIVREADLIEALQTRRIAGAALDVFSQEPLPPESPLWTLPNVFITPHVAGVASDRHWLRVLRQFADNLERFLRGQPLRNVVDKRLGY
jgi:phosphoglycerate dehydrogenase-like enzyme